MRSSVCRTGIRIMTCPVVLLSFADICVSSYTQVEGSAGSGPLTGSVFNHHPVAPKKTLGELVGAEVAEAALKVGGASPVLTGPPLWIQVSSARRRLAEA